MALGLRRDGTVVATRFPWASGKAPHPLAGARAVQVTVNDGYYGTTAAAALLPDGTVRAYIGDKPLESALSWREIVRIACCDSAVFALDQQGVLYCGSGFGIQTAVEDIQDFACGLCDVVALDFSGKLHHFDRRGKEERLGSGME